jgi:hypothetical protein
MSDVMDNWGYRHALSICYAYCLSSRVSEPSSVLDCVWNVMAHAQKPDFVLRPNGWVHLNRRERQFSLLLAGELRTSACRVCTARANLCSSVMWRLLVTHSILLFPLHFSRASPRAITFQLDSTFIRTLLPLFSVFPVNTRRSCITDANAGWQAQTGVAYLGRIAWYRGW